MTTLLYLALMAPSSDTDARAALALAASRPPQAPSPPQSPPAKPAPWLSPVECPKGMTPYQSARWTQDIAVLDGFDRISRVPRRGLSRKWRESGGMLGVKGWKSDKYRLVPGKVTTWIGPVAVTNSFGHVQTNNGIRRSYPDGTRFDDVLSHDGKVFEHRSREKVGGRWVASVLYEDERARPAGYHGLTASCASCHDQAGTGGYATGLVPGGDTVISDELDWSVVSAFHRRAEPPVTEEEETTDDAGGVYRNSDRPLSGDAGWTYWKRERDADGKSWDYWKRTVPAPTHRTPLLFLPATLPRRDWGVGPRRVGGGVRAFGGGGCST